jgi:glutamyl-tRNA synthetase
MPLLLGSDGRKLSKRRNPTSINYYKDSGYLPQALSNFLTLMGYSMPSDKEIYDLDEIIKEFDYKRIGVSGAFFDIKKLDWLNQHYLINRVKTEELWGEIKKWQFNDERMEALMPLVHSRIKTFGEFIELCGFLFVNNLSLKKEDLPPKGLSEEQAASLLQLILWELDRIEDWKKGGIESASKRIVEITGLNLKKSVIPLLYMSITGKTQGPPLFASFEFLGKDRARARLLGAIELLGGISKKSLSNLEHRFKTGDCKASFEAPV